MYQGIYNLYFYKNETTKKELDFIVQIDGEVVPIEVKSSNTKSNSLNSIIKKNTNIHYAYKFINGNVGVGEDGIVTLPLYMVMFL